MKKLVGTIIVVIIAITALFYFLKPANDAASYSDSTRVGTHKISTSETVLLRENKLGISDDELKKAKNETQILRAVSPNQIDQRTIPDYFKNIEQGVLFQYNPAVIETKNVGDHIQFKLLKFGLNRQAKIQSVEQIDDDIIRWSGVFDGEAPDLNHFSITQSQKDNYSIIKIFTDKGNYVAEVKNGVGLATSINDDLHDDGIHEQH